MYSMYVDCQYMYTITIPSIRKLTKTTIGARYNNTGQTTVMAMCLAPENSTVMRIYMICKF